LLRRFRSLAQRFAFVAGNDVATHTLTFSRRNAPELCKKISPSENRGRRKYRVPVAPAASCAKCRKHTSSHHRFTGTPGISCAMVLTVSFVLSSVTGLCCHRRSASHPAKLDASVGASGPHDFAVRAARLASLPRPPHPAPTSVTIMIRPSCEGGTAI
jgi:hypothetical protein